MKTLVLSMISIAATVAAMTACTSESDGIDEVDPIVNAKSPIEFKSSIIGIETKTIKEGSSFSNGNEIGVYGYKKEAPTDYTQNSLFKNKTFTYENNAFTATEAYWERGEKHFFYAYYPVATTTASSTGYQLTEGTADAAPFVTVSCKENTGIEEDLLWAQPNDNGFDFTGTSTINNIALPFTHQLARIAFSVKLADATVPSANLTNISFKVNKSGGTMNLITGVTSATDGEISFSKTITSTPVTVDGINADEFSPIIMPQSDISDLSIIINGQTFTVTMGTQAQFEKGKITKITITVSSKNITFNSTITEWGDNTTGAGAGSI